LLWLGILGAGLWPFNFLPRNRTQWIGPAAGIHFYQYGQVYSDLSWALNDSANSGNFPFTIELWLHPAEVEYPRVGPVFSIFGFSEENNFTIAQSGPDLVVQGYFRERSNTQGYRQLWLDDACRSSHPLFVAIASGERGTGLYWVNNFFHAKNYSEYLPEKYFGRLLVGQAPSGHVAWSGDVTRLAVYDRVLTADEIQTQYHGWKYGTPFTVTGVRARYTFEEGSGNIARDHSGSAPDLVLPVRFRPLHPTVLEMPHPFKRSDVLDSVVNILGFVPFGFLFCAYIHDIPPHSAARAILGAVIVGALTSLGIELLQIFLPSRDSSLLDLLNNTLGMTLGSVLQVLAHGRWAEMISRFSPVPPSRLGQ
jgi:VanZ family protein